MACRFESGSPVLEDRIEGIGIKLNIGYGNRKVVLIAPKAQHAHAVADIELKHPAPIVESLIAIRCPEYLIATDLARNLLRRLVPE